MAVQTTITVDRWEDPPPANRVTDESRAFIALVETLRAQPGRWALIWPAAKSGGVSMSLKRYGLEATTRALGNGRIAVYARYPKGSTN